jgi:F-type H+-transporting ATPase subunit delta
MAIKGDLRVARRYAAALFEAARNIGPDGIEAVSSDLSVISELLAGVPYLRSILNHPLVSDERKRKVLADTFASRLGDTSLNFLYLLVRKRREGIVDQAIEEFRRFEDVHAGRLEASVESARPLSDDELTRLQGALEARSGKSVRLTASVDAAMLGGVRVRIGDEIIDAGLNTRLEELRWRLASAR